MSPRHVYFDDETSVETAKKELQRLREADPSTQHALINQYQDAKDGKNIAERVLTDTQPNPKEVDALARSMALNTRLEADYQKPFEELLQKETLRLRNQFTHANSFMHSRGYENFDASDLFVRMAFGNGRIILSSPVIMPFHAPDDICFKHDKPNPDMKLFTFGTAAPLEDFSSRLALFSMQADNKSGQHQLCAIPLILVDAAIMSSIQPLTQSGDPNIKEITNRLLLGLQSLVSFGMHDYVHQMILSIADPQTKNLRQTGDSAPLHNLDTEARQSMFRSNHHFRPDAESNINALTNVYELHAELVNRDLWHESFRNTPAIKTNMVRTATQFISDLEMVRRELVKSQGEEFANRFSNYMTTLAMSRFLRVMDINDPALNKPMTLHNGAIDSFVSACEKLALNPLEIDARKAKKLLKYIQLDAIVDSSTTPESPGLLKVFSDNPTVFPNLNKIFHAEKSGEGVKLTGFENVIARGFGAAGKTLNVSALMYNFPEGDGPILNTAKLLDDNYGIVRTGENPIPPDFALPDTFRKAMQQCHAAAAKQLGGSNSPNVGM